MTSRIAVGMGALVAAAALVVVPGPVAAAPADDQQPGCEIGGGSMAWGLKESFRAYISGSIANGSWETSDGAEYETPDFLWSDASGRFDPETGTGTVSFTGTLHFTGHDGVLDLTLSNPTIEFEGEGVAALLLDARSNDMEGELAVDAEQEWVGDVVVDSALTPSGGTVALDGMPVTLTNSGAGAFAGFYEAGVELDPLSLTLELGDCGAGADPEPSDPPAAGEPSEVLPGADEAASDAPEEIPWLPISVGGVALLVIGVTVGLLIGGRRPAAGPPSGAGSGRAQEEAE